MSPATALGLSRRSAGLSAAALSLCLLLSGCESANQSATADAFSIGKDVRLAAPAAVALSVEDAEQVLAQGVMAAQALGVAATLAVTDRVGNVLALYVMQGAAATTRIRPGPGEQNLVLQGLEVPAPMAAISKAITGAYLSSAGNAFSTRTASMIVQEHFPPAPSTAGLESGPLFGVQFSQLPCSDLNTRAAPDLTPGPGPHRAPLGLAADPGGFPLYKNGVVVGGLGVMADGDYGFDTNILDVDQNLDEQIAWAATAGFRPAIEIAAPRISVDGTTLRYSDISNVESSAVDVAVLQSAGQLQALTGYYQPAASNRPHVGTAYGTPESGLRALADNSFAPSDAYVLVDAADSPRFAPRAGTDADRVSQPLSQDEVESLLREGLEVMRAARAQIRRPLNSRAQVSITVVDTHGQVLGLVRGPDAPIFGTDVALQKARTAAFFSSSVAADDLLATPGPLIPGFNPSPAVADFVTALRDFVQDPLALTGGEAFSDRAGGNLSRPYFPDGERGTPAGPLSMPISQWSPFATGLQASLIVDNILQHVGHVLGLNADTPAQCTALPDIAALPGMQNRLSNGIQIFPGSVPIYRGSELIGGIGVSGDGIDQDDMIALLAVARTSRALETGLNNAPPEMRADQRRIPTARGPIRLRYVSCPFAPFVDSDSQQVCEGL